MHELRAALRELLERPDAGTHDGLAGVLRLQVRPADRRRPRARLPLPAEPVLRRGAAAARSGTDPAVADYVLEREETQEFLAPRRWGCSTSRCRATSARARAISRSPSAAPAGATARWCWSRSCARRLAARGLPRARAAPRRRALSRAVQASLAARGRREVRIAPHGRDRRRGARAARRGDGADARERARARSRRSRPWRRDRDDRPRTIRDAHRGGRAAGRPRRRACSSSPTCSATRRPT